MKKKLAKITSCLLCLAMLFSIAAPAVAATTEQEVFFEDLLDGEEIVFAPDLEVSDGEVSIDAPAADEDNLSAMDSLPEASTQVSPFALTGEYEIYPTPQSVVYGTGTVTLPTTMQVTYGEGIDSYTKDRAVEAFAEAGVTLSESASTAVKLQVSIDATLNTAKYDAYTLTIDATGVTVVGQHTDAAFYGLTTVKRILQQVEGRQVRHLTVEDYADVAFRGFIEGYYGNPWTVEDRAALMEFGGELKMNIYFYAPKDDPKHSSKWRELYTEEELETKIRPLAEAGNKSKCYYGFALHPFWAEGINYTDDTAYAADLEVLKAKFEQTMSVGVRQIAVLADDRGVPGVGVERSYIRLMNDLTEWVSSEEMQTKYPGLKTSIPFCPNDYMGNASSDQMQALKALPDSVPIIQTGGTIWGSVSNSYLNTYRSNMGDRGVFMWVNWPCSDKSQGSLIMGAHDTVLQNNLTEQNISDLKGIMLNPMQQSEPSKAAIFYNADYSWNVWNGSDSAERIEKVWDDSFKYVDHDSAIQTAESDALRELSKHMIHNNGVGATSWRFDWHDSTELNADFDAFRQAMEGNALTAEQIAAMKAHFQTLHDAAVLYRSKSSGNMRILGQRKAGGGYVDAQEQMAPWLDYWVEYTQATLDLLDALSLMVDNADGSNDSGIVEKYLSGQGNLTAANSHSFLYVDHYENALAGGEYLAPFTNELLAIVSDEAKTILDPASLIESIITNRTDTPEGGLDAMRDGDSSTEAVFKNPNSIAEGTYVGVKYNRPIDLTSVRFEVGRSANTNDTFNDSKLQYMDESGQWVDIPGATFAHADLVLEATGLNLTAKGVRVIATSERTGTWLGIKEIYINGQSGSNQDAEDELATGQLTGSVIHTSEWGISGNNPTSNLIDGNDSTHVYFDSDSNKAAGSTRPADTSLVGDYIGLDLGRVVKNVGRVRFVIGNGSDADKWTDFKLQYSTDNANWIDAGTYRSTNNKDVIEEDLGGVEARYIRFVNTVQIHKWLRFSELSVWADESAAAARIIYQSDAVKKLEGPSAVLADDFASLSVNTVMLRPGEFVGIALPRIRAVTEIVADYTPAPGLVLKVGMSEANMQVVETYSSDTAQLFANEDAVIPYNGYARYVRLENVSQQTVSTRINELSVSSEEIEAIHFEEDMTQMGFDANYGNQDTRENVNFFDGNMSTSTTLANKQVAGEYVTYDLGQLRPIQKLTMAMNESNTNYLRHGVLEVSPDGETWTTILTVNNDGADFTQVKDGAASDPSFRLGVPSQNCAAFVGEVPQAVEARYLRIRVTEGGYNTFVAAAEILINTENLNDIEYLPSVNDPTYAADPIEQGADYTPAMTRDGDLTTGFRPNMDGKTSGSFTYRFSDETAIGQINVVQDTANPSNASVQIRTIDGWQTLSGVTLNKGLNQIMIPEDVADVLEVKLSWGNVTPTFYEIITVPRELVTEGGQAPSDPETTPINSYSGTARTFNFDENWKFNLGDASGASALVYNDSAWRTLNLPHDFSIEQEFSTSSGEAESGYLLGGTGWYRKAFTIDSSWENKVVAINFGGAYMDTEVYLNGTKLGEHHYGYTPFSFVLPGNLLNYTGENVLAVKVVNTVPSSRWYSGSGLYRSTHLTVTDPVHVARYGTKVETPAGSNGKPSGTVNVTTSVENNGSAAASVTVTQEIYELDATTFEKKGSPVATNTSSAASVAANATATVEQAFNVPSPKLWNSWDKGDPNLYVLVTTVKSGSTVLDTYETEFGFRTIDWDVNTGFKLNAVNVKLKGVCQHHDQGALGAEAWYRALERQVEILMDMGVNSIRVTHNPAADELIDICNRKGILIIDEAFDGWSVAKNGNRNDFSRWYNQTIGVDNTVVGGNGQKWYQFVFKTMIQRDINAPSVIMYSICNEVQEGASFGSDFIDIATDLIAIGTSLDSTRFLTRGDNTRSTGGDQGTINQKLIDAGGVVGFNYAKNADSLRPGTNLQGRDAFPGAYTKGWSLYAAETASHTNSRGIYNRKSDNGDDSAGDGRLTSYDKSSVGWGQTASNAWWDIIRFDYRGGEYIWTGFDYIGEPTPYNGTGTGVGGSYWPNAYPVDLAAKSSYFGAIDTNGLPKDNFWLYRSMWNETDTTLHVLPTWDQDDIMIDSDGNVEVVVYSNAPQIKVFLNGNEVGSATSVEHRSNDGNGIYTYRTFDSGTGTFTKPTQSVLQQQTLYATFNVPYTAGTLEVKAYNESGVEITDTVGRDVVRTTSGASKLTAEADRKTITNDGRDLSYITISVTDKNGNIVNGAANSITVSVSGDGVFMGMDNGVQTDHTSYLSSTRKAGAGQLVAIVQSTKDEGQFTLTATADGLTPATVTVKTSGAVSETTGNAPVSYDLSKTIYVQLNTEPTLPTETEVTLANGSKVTKAITWAEYDKSLLATAGSEFAITGAIADYNIAVSIGIVVLDDIAALLNYSDAVRVGQTPNLPVSRPAVMADGTVVSAQFPVTWDEPDPKVYNKAGTVVVNGTAEAFGKEYTVTATVRVSKGEFIEGGSASGAAVNPIVNGAASNDLLKAFDGSTSTTWTGSGTASVAFDTAQNLYRIVLTYATTVPTGANAPTITLATGNVTIKPKVTGTTATYELGTIYSSETVALNFPGQVTLADVQLITAAPVFPIGATAELEDLKLNGQSATAEQLAAKIIKTSSANAVINAVSSKNVALTILPENSDSKIIIVTESEDHTQRAVYTVQLDAFLTDNDDDSKDYPYTKTTATTPSQQTPAHENVEGPVEFVVDNDPATYWHSNWNQDLSSQPEKRYVQLTLEEATELVALRYKPRPSVANGIVTKYRVEVSTDGTNFTPVASGDWAHDTTTKLAMFDSPVTAKYVRLYGVETRGSSGDTPNKFMSCAELRVVQSENKIDLSIATITVTPKEFQWKNVEIRPGSGSEADVDATVVVTLNGEVLTRGTDYVLTYENNVDPGTAYIYATAPASSTKYQGAAATTFQIVKAEAKITSFEPFTVRVYPGIAPALPEEVWANTTDPATGAQNRIAVPVIWDEVPEDWYNFPQEKTRTLAGAIEDPDMLSDPDLAPEITLSFAYSKSVDSISMVTPVGVAPSLPDEVTVQFDDGTSAKRTVAKWYLKGDNDKTPLTAAAFNTAGQVVELEGEIVGIDRVKATASVRVAESSGSEWVAGDTNIALNTNSASNIFPFAMAYESAGNNNPYQAIKGTQTGSTAATDRWSDWERGKYHNPIWMGVAFEATTANITRAENTVLSLNTKKVAKVKLMFVDENGTGGSVTYPADYEIQYYTGPVTDLTFDTRINSGDTSTSNGGNGRVRYWTTSPLLNDDNWQTVSYSSAKPAVPSSNGQMLDIPFDAVDTALIRVLCSPKSGKWVGISALEVYEAIEQPIPPAANANFTVSSITLGGEEKKTSFTTDTDGNKVLEVLLPQGAAIPELAVTATDNAAVSITQASRVPGVAEVGAAWAQAVVTSEDGSKTETYLVKFTREGAPAGYFIELDPNVPISDKITISPMGGAAGTEITVTVAKGYQLTDLWVKVMDGDKAGQMINVKDGKFLMPPGNVSFSAGVSAIPYKIEYLLNGGTVERHNTTSYNVETPTFTLYNPTRGGYVFQGWVGTGLSEPTKTVSVARGSIGDRTYIAVWSANGSIGGGGGNNSGGSNTSSTPVGNVTTTTTNPATGAVTVTTATSTGLVTAVTTNPDGTQSAVIQIPQNSSSTVDAVMPTLDAAVSPEVKVQNNTTRPVSVTIPMTGSDTVVAVRLESDGTETVIPLSVVDENGLRVKTQPGTQTIRLMDNKKTFVDVPNTHWASNAVDFVSSRELFNGLGTPETFAPAGVMDRAMMTTVLWRLAEKPSASLETLFDDVQSGSYYEEAVAWGVAAGVVKGTDIGFEPTSPVTRETMAALLYRFAGSPTVVDEMPRRFSDGAQVSDWAHDAVVWCIANDIIRGREDGTIDPKAVATRAEVAAMLQRFVNQQV